jgi:hypothetical protein
LCGDVAAEPSFVRQLGMWCHWREGVVMLRATWRRLFGVSMAGMAVACSTAATPTSMCACPPARTALRVIGIVRSPQGAPASRVRVVLVNRSTGAVQGGFGAAGQQGFETDSLGGFRSTTFSGSSPGARNVRGGFVRTGATDTTWLDLGIGVLRNESSPLDSMVISVQIQ